MPIVMKSEENGIVDAKKKVVILPRREPKPDRRKMAMAGLTMLSLASVPAGAAVITLSDQNSTVKIDTSVGLTSWSVDGVNQLNTQQFYYRLGDSGGQSLLSSIDASPVVVPPVTDQRRQHHLHGVIIYGTSHLRAVWKWALARRART